MSRIGKQSIQLNDKIEAKVNEKVVTIIGPEGELSIELPHHLDAKIENDQLVVNRKGEDRFIRSLHGTFRMLIANAVKGVQDKYEKKLEIVGLGYRGKMEGNIVNLSLGFTHQVKVEVPDDLEVDMPDEVTITVKGIDKQLVGEFAAKLRSLKKPEPYKGKGIRYSDEEVRRKSPKASIVGGEGEGV